MPVLLTPLYQTRSYALQKEFIMKKATQLATSVREQEPLDIFNRHLATFNTGDLEAVLNDFAENAVVITSDGVFEGHDQIRKVYAGLLAEFGVINRGDSPGFTIEKLHARHDTLFIVWHARSLRHVFEFGTDTFVCGDGLIQRQSIAFATPRPAQ